MNKFEDMDTLSRSMACAAKTCYTAMEILHESKRKTHWKDIIKEIPNRVDFNDWENEVYKKSKEVRWQKIFLLQSIDMQKAGYLRKQDGMWSITKAGEKAIQMGAVGFINATTERYKEWEKTHKEPEETLFLLEHQTRWSQFWQPVVKMFKRG